MLCAGKKLAHGLWLCAGRSPFTPDDPTDQVKGGNDNDNGLSCLTQRCKRLEPGSKFCAPSRQPFSKRRPSRESLLSGRAGRLQILLCPGLLLKAEPYRSVGFCGRAFILAPKIIAMPHWLEVLLVNTTKHGKKLCTRSLHQKRASEWASNELTVWVREGSIMKHKDCSHFMQVLGGTCHWFGSAWLCTEAKGLVTTTWLIG